GADRSPIARAAARNAFRDLAALRVGWQGRRRASRSPLRLWRSGRRTCSDRTCRAGAQGLAARGGARRTRGRGGPAMKLAITVRVSPESGVDMETVWEAERLWYAEVWCGAAYGTDAVTPVAWGLAQTQKIKGGTSI